MKRISLIIFLVSFILIGNAQNNTVPNIRGKKLQNKNKQEQTVQKQGEVQNDTLDIAPDVTSENREVSPSSKSSRDAVIPSEEYVLIEKAVSNAFLIVRKDYNVRDESGENITGNDFFGTVYSVVPLLQYGFGVDTRFLKPWKFDPKYDANIYDESRVFVEKVQYKKLKEATFKLFTMNQKVSESLGSGFYNVVDSTFQNHGFNVELGNGMKTGYMVWFFVNEEGETSVNIQPTVITFNENTIFNVKQPTNAQYVIGGAFLNLNVDEPGCIRLNLMGVARIDPYGGKKWELVKLQSKPTPPEVDSPKDTKNSKNEEAESVDKNDEDAIIPEQDGAKDKKNSKEAKSDDKSSKAKKTKVNNEQRD